MRTKGKKSDCDLNELDALKRCMKYSDKEPINVFKINDEYIIAIYEGEISEYDIIIRYRQRDSNGNWSRIRTPKHIHWAVDMLIKMQKSPELTKNFLNFLLDRWAKVEPIKSEEERILRTSYEYIAKIYENELDNYKELSKHGEYSVKFLIFLADLLMTQEKTNRQDAYMFEKLIKAIMEGKQIYQIVSIATHTGD